MGMFDSILGSVVKSVSNSDQGQAINLIKLLLENSGGVQNILKLLQNSNIADALTSWLSNTQENKSINASNILDVFGKDTISTIAGKADVKSDIAANLIAQYLPQVISKVAANANTQDLSSLNLGDVGNILGKFLK